VEEEEVVPKRTKKTSAPVHYDRDGILALEGDMRSVLAGMEAESFSACVTDPPYHLTQASRGGSPRMPGRNDRNES